MIILFFCLELAVPCILHLENIISGVVMVLLEGIYHCRTGVVKILYLKEVKHMLNNGILVEDTENWVIPT